MMKRRQASQKQKMQEWSLSPCLFFVFCEGANFKRVFSKRVYQTWTIAENDSGSQGPRKKLLSSNPRVPMLPSGHLVGRTTAVLLRNNPSQ